MTSSKTMLCYAAVAPCLLAKSQIFFYFFCKLLMLRACGSNGSRLIESHSARFLFDLNLQWHDMLVQDSFPISHFTQLRQICSTGLPACNSNYNVVMATSQTHQNLPKSGLPVCHMTCKTENCRKKLLVAS